MNYKKTIISFLSVLLVCIFAGALFIQSRMNNKKLEMEYLIIEKSTQISDSIFKLLYKTEILSALIMQGNGDIENFDLMARTIMDDPAILNMLIAPDGVVSKAYPPASAETLVGLNFFDENEWAGNREALLARDTGQLVLAGPFVVTSGDLAMADAFTDYSVIWKPRDIVGGDIYWLRAFDKGTVLSVADCTGHGTPGALLTMLVASALDSIVWNDNCDDTADIVYKLDHKLSEALNINSGDGGRRRIMDIDDGCDIAVMFIAKDGTVSFSSGNIPVFTCDGTDVIRYKGQKFFVGEGKLQSKDDVIVQSVPANPGCKFYIASDGLFDQIGKQTEGSKKKRRKFGYKTFKNIILENHSEKLPVITGKVWEAYEQYRGIEAQRDDFELVAIEP